MAKNGGDNISKYRHVIAKPMIALRLLWIH
jgi:hypothetical protein